MSIREAREKLSTENEHRDDLLQRYKGRNLKEIAKVLIQNFDLKKGANRTIENYERQRTEFK